MTRNFCLIAIQLKQSNGFYSQNDHFQGLMEWVIFRRYFAACGKNHPWHVLRQRPSRPRSSNKSIPQHDHRDENFAQRQPNCLPERGTSAAAYDRSFAFRKLHLPHHCFQGPQETLPWFASPHPLAPPLWRVHQSHPIRSILLVSVLCSTGRPPAGAVDESFWFQERFLIPPGSWYCFTIACLASGLSSWWAVGVAVQLKQIARPRSEPLKLGRCRCWHLILLAHHPVATDPLTGKKSSNNAATICVCLICLTPEKQK